MVLKIAERIEKMQNFLESMQVVSTGIGYFVVSLLLVVASIWLFKGLFRWILRSISDLLGLISERAPAVFLSYFLVIAWFFVGDFAIEKGLPELLWTMLGIASIFGVIWGLYLDLRRIKKLKNKKVLQAEPELGPPA